MNPNRKDNSGWILCPSKSFPGKFYYFNVNNGETAWSLNDDDKRPAKRNSYLEKITAKTHNYPEPASPPIDCQTPNISQIHPIYAPQMPITNISQTPMFGQSVLPKYITPNPNPYVQNIIWTPIQLPTPMFVANAPVKPTIDQNTQTFSPEQELRVQTCKIPLSKRFNNFEKPLINFNKNNKVVNNDQSNIFNDPKQIQQPFGSTSKIQMFDKKRVNLTLRPSNDLIPKRSRTKSDSESIIGQSDDKDMLRMIRDRQKSVGEILTLTQDDMVDNVKRKNLMTSGLDRTDLRFLLEAKKKKSVTFGDLANEIDNKSKVHERKRISFNLDRNEFSDDGTERNMISACDTYTEERNTLKILRDLSSPSPTGLWYIAVDTEILSKELVFIERFVQLDPNCRLLVPYAVAAAARRDLLTRPQAYIHVQTLETKGTGRNISTMDRILYCCMKTSEDNYHVVLITNDTKLYNKAKLFHIHCFKLDEIKHGLRPEVACEAKKIHVTIDNPQEILFFQSTNELDHFPLTEKINVMVDASRKQLLDKTSVGVMKKISHPNTPQIHSEHFIDTDEAYEVTRLNMKHSVDYASDVSETTSEIGRGIQKILIKPTGSEGKNKHNTHKRPFENQMTFDIQNTQTQSSLLDSLGNGQEKEIAPSQIQCSIQNKTVANNLQRRNYDDSDREQRHIEIRNRTKQNTFEIQNQYEKQKEFDIQKRSMCEKKKFTEIKKENGCKNQSVLDDKLKGFQVTNKEMEDAINFKIEEWFCSFSQIMEDALSTVLQQFRDSNSIPLSPPWSLQEAAICIKEVYSDQNVTAAVDKLIMLLHNNTCDKGKLKTEMNPNDFMRIIGSSVVLIRYLQVLQTDSEVLTEAEQLLIAMIRNIKEPLPQNQDELPRCSIPTHLEEETLTPRHYFVKNSSEIIKYLQKHFLEWRNYDVHDKHNENTQTTILSEAKIVRTCGRNLKNLTIDKTKSMSLNQPVIDNLNVTNKPIDKELQRDTDKIVNVEKGTIDNLQVIDIIEDNDCCNNLFVEPKTMRTLHVSDLTAQKNGRNLDKIILNNPLHSNTFGDISNDGPKVIRNIKLIDSFEEKLKAQHNLNVHPTSRIVLSVINNNFNNTNENIINCNENIDFEQINGTDLDSDVRIVMNNDNIDVDNDMYTNDDCVINRDDYTNDSGFENDSLQAYSFLKIFLTELCASLKAIYKFIDDNIMEFRDDDNIEDDRRRRLRDKATLTHYQLANIIDKLKSIKQRECNGNGELRALLIKAGIQAFTDKRMTRYKQVVTKCLEQAQMLEKALKMMLALTNDDIASVSSVSRQTSHNYYNVFECI